MVALLVGVLARYLRMVKLPYSVKTQTICQMQYIGEISSYFSGVGGGGVGVPVGWGYPCEISVQNGL